jgi:hypothetical protein
MGMKAINSAKPKILLLFIAQIPRSFQHSAAFYRVFLLNPDLERSKLFRKMG